MTLLDNLIPPYDVMRRAKDLQARSRKDLERRDQKTMPAIPVTEAECAAAEPLVEIQPSEEQNAHFDPRGCPSTSWTSNSATPYFSDVQDWQIND